MYETKNKTESTPHVGCGVRDCLYHSENDRCQAERIIVSNEHARRKAETFCATFECRGNM